MTKRRSRGDGGLWWNETRHRWIAEVTIGYTPAGKRITKRVTGKTKTDAKNKLKEILRDHDDGVTVTDTDYTVAQAINDWLANYELSGHAENTIRTKQTLIDNHIMPALGARKLVKLTPDDVDRWLATEAEEMVTSTLRHLHSILRRAITRAQARDKVKRNVVLLCSVPTGKGKGRPSKALTLTQAEALLGAAEQFPAIHAYIVVGLLTGARTEELRALDWDHVDWNGRPNEDPPIPPNIKVWRSVRKSGDTKTRKSRRSLALAQRAIDALKTQRELQDIARQAAGARWHNTGIVFTTTIGTAMDAANVRRAFRQVIKAAGLNPEEWTPRELRHSFVSLLSDAGIPIEEISRLVGHSGTSVTELVYRKQIRPVIEHGAKAMDRIFRNERAS